jgi:hypothetical protein
MKPETQKLFDEATAVLENGQVAPDGASEVGMGDGRTIYVSCETWNRHVAARRIAEKALREERKAEGVAFWAQRRIAPGDKVVRPSASIFGMFLVHGIAKAGARGAYVTSDIQRGMLTPHGWDREKEAAA